MPKNCEECLICECVLCQAQKINIVSPRREERMNCVYTAAAKFPDTGLTFLLRPPPSHQSGVFIRRPPQTSDESHVQKNLSETSCT